MIGTVFVVSVTFGTESEFQIVIIQLGSSADCTFVTGNHGMSVTVYRLSSGTLCIVDFTFECCLPLHLRRGNSLIIPRHEEENQEVCHCNHYRKCKANKYHLSGTDSVADIGYHLIAHQSAVNPR